MTLGRQHHEIDAAGMVLGRLASRVANLLRGKHKVGFRAQRDGGDFVTVIHCANIKLIGRKMAQKVYRRFTGYPGGLKEIPIRRLLEKHPTRVVSHAVFHMLDDNRLRQRMMKRLKLKP